MYHRVVDGDFLDRRFVVGPRHFAEHLEVLARHYHPLPLEKLVRELRRGRLPERAVAITFDDGYADNLYNAKPLLEACGIPATVFVTSGNLGDGSVFWWDRLEQILVQVESLPPMFRLGRDGKSLEWDTITQAVCVRTSCHEWSEADDQALLRSSSRYALFDSMRQLLLPLAEDDCNRVVDELAKVARVKPLLGPLRRPLSQAELNVLSQGSLVAIEAHSVTHPVLSSQPTEVQRAEIWGSKTTLERMLGREVVGFAYPFGAYTQETAALVREAGFAYACTVESRAVALESSRFELPRMTVEDWDGEEFAARLGSWT